ncbi:hypothetical protein ACO0OL_001400 [Hanseniaspora opuntiae]|uniref:GTP cyclohydrolase 1 n=1 Tax=Hanseniaspora opuntiae TaxID=211096 RepID=A0A1E5RX30_9ASCO|nr:GTP cyclohydrolase 1 [Hanseniaspora opuntiae]
MNVYSKFDTTLVNDLKEPGSTSSINSDSSSKLSTLTPLSKNIPDFSDEDINDSNHLLSKMMQNIKLHEPAKNTYKRLATSDEELTSKIAYHMKEILELIGEDPQREGLLDTPKRYAKAMLHYTKGYTDDLRQVINNALFESESDEDMIIVKNINFHSSCEHHLAPFFGTCSIGYIPNGKIIGLSKFARIVEVCARRLQVQERLGRDILNIITEALNPKFVVVTIEAEHMCMTARGVQKQGTKTITKVCESTFEDKKEKKDALNEFFVLYNSMK